MFLLFLLALWTPILIILILLSSASNIASKEVIQTIQRCELDRDKDNASLSEMIEYHKRRPTIRYKI